MTALPGLLARALWRGSVQAAGACWRWARDPANRRGLTVLPFVLLGHVLLVWLLIQNRWIVMSETTITFMPPIMASIMLSAPVVGKDSKPAANNGKPDRRPAPGELTLKSSPELSFGAFRVQRSVPWLNTELLPELRGNNADPKADRQERVGAADPRQRERQARNTAPAAKPAERRPPKQVARSNQPAATPAPAEPLPAAAPPPPAPPALALIPPPPALPEARPLPPPPVIPAPAIPPIPDPVQSGPREIPPLWANNPAPPPPVLTVIPTTPPALATVPATPPPAPAPAAEPAPATAAAAAPPPPRTAAAVAPPPPPKPLPPPVEAAAPPPAPPAPAPAPLVLTPATELPMAATPPPVATTVVITPPPSMLPSAPDAAGTSATSTPAPASTAATPARNPMVVEIPRYRLAPPSPDAAPGAPAGPGTSGSATSASDAGGRTGPDGAGSKNGSVLGLGVEAPALLPLPTASAPGSAPSKALNLTLPRVEAYRPPMGRQPSLSELANAQLRRGKPKDPMADGMDDAATPDCMRPGKDQTATGLLAGPVVAYNALTGKCK